MESDDIIVISIGAKGKEAIVAGNLKCKLPNGIFLSLMA